MTRVAVVLTTIVVVLTAYQGCASRKAARVPELDKRVSFALRCDAAARLVSTGQFKQATSLLRKLERQAGSQTEKATVYGLEASLHLARHELAPAEEYASRAIRTCPALVSGYRVRGVARRQRGNLSGAVQDFNSVLAAEPDDVESLRGLAEIFIGQNETLDAVRTLERYLRVDSSDARAQDAWCSSMASILGYDRFPVEYLETVKNKTLTRGELAAVLVVELEMGRLENKTSSRPKMRQLVDIRPDRPSAFSRPAVEYGDTLTPVPRSSHAPEKRTGQTPVLAPDCARFWFAPFVEKAVSLGLLDLYPDSTFRPGDIVTKGILALEVYFFLDRHCGHAFAGVRTRWDEQTRHTGGQPGQDTGPGRSTSSGYVDVDDSSYLSRPVLVVTALGIMPPSSDVSFGTEAPISGEEVKAVARGLAAVLDSTRCNTGD